MLVLKKLFSGNYLKKLHIVKNNLLNDNIESNIIEEEKDIKENINETKEINDNNKFNLISIYESSLDITYCEYDSIIKQYIQTSILHQDFFFVIFDSEIIDSKIILLTSIGLFIYQYEKDKLNLLLYEIFNIKCEPKDLLMYLKINKKLNIIVIYSNTNLFFLYHYDEKSNKFIKVNQINKLCNGYINHINIFNLDQINNYFIVSIQTNLSNAINDIFKKIKENYKEENIKAIRYDLSGKYIFIINNDCFIILKNKGKDSNNNIIIDLMIKFKFKYGQNINTSFFIDYQKIKNYHFIFFDNKISIFEEKKETLSRIKLIPKEQKTFLKNTNAIFHSINNGNEISMILYNYKNDITFLKLKQEEKNEENVCGLQGESRLVKYSNIYNEIILHNQQIDSQINSIIFPFYNFRKNYFSNLFITSNNSRSILYLLSNTYQIDHLIDFESPTLKIYPLINNLNYIIIFKSGVSILSFNDENNLKNYKINNLYESNNTILFSFYFIYKEQEYLVIYLNNRHLLCFNINLLSNIFDIELNNLPQPSALGVIAIERLNKLGFVLGNYINNHIIIIYYDFENNCFDKEKISETKLLDSTGNTLLTPDDILIYKYYIFITTHTGDFIKLV